MIVAERPGREEQQRGYVLCGKSGLELDRHLLCYSGIDRATVRCCNLVTDYREGDNPTQAEVERDWPILVDELARTRPRYIGAMGLWSARALLGQHIEMEWASGLPFPLALPHGERVTVMPLIHTAATLHQPKYAVHCMHGFTQFGRMCRGEYLSARHLEPPRRHTYSEGTMPLGEIVAMDTEGTVQQPWGLSYSSIRNVASVQRARARKHRKWDCASLEKALVILHGAMHDLPVLSKMGVRPRHWTDTLLMAALLGTEPHGLKPLAQRHLGLQLQDYSDVVAEAQREKALQCLGDVVEWASRKERSGKV